MGHIYFIYKCAWNWKYGKNTEVKYDSANSIESEDKSMNLEETISHENMPSDDLSCILTKCYRYYNRDEVKEVIERAQKEYYNHFLPQFISDQLTLPKTSA